MKRAGNLISEIVDLNNLYHAFWKASRGKMHKQEVQLYHQNLNENINLLQNQILSEQIEIGDYNYFTIYDPKKRTICAASFPERVLHHSIMNVSHNYFEKYQIADSYATRINKGTYKALKRAAYYSRKYKYYLKLDIRKYFDSINHNILKNNLQKLFKDKILLNLFFKIIDTYQTEQNRGLPIGNLTSQYFANHYLATFDHFVKEKLKAKAYIRYMDDMVIWSNSISELNVFLKIIIEYLREKLSLELKIKISNTTKHGLSFLSYRIFKTHTELTSKSKKRFILKLNKYHQNLKTEIWTQTDFQRHALPLYAFTEHASAKGFRKKCLTFDRSQDIEAS